MSLQAIINPLEFMKKRTGFDGSRTLGEVERGRTNTPLKPGMLDYVDPMNEMSRQMEMNRRRQEIENTGGFDASDLMARPEMRQAETRNQAAMVSAPYEEANRKAAEKTNPMNAASQNPGKKFLMAYIGK